MSGRQKRDLFRIVTAGVVTLVLAFMPLEAGVRLWLCLIPYMIVGWDVLYMAVRNLLRGQLLDEQFLMAAATAGLLEGPSSAVNAWLTASAFIGLE